MFIPHPRAHTHSLILHLAGNDIKASLLLAGMERRSFSISNRASFFVFRNGMFNTMKSLSPAPSFSVMGSKLQRGALFMGRLACAGMRTKAGRKLALERTLPTTGGLGFQQTQPGSQGRFPQQGLNPRAGAGGGGGSPGAQEPAQLEDKQMSTAPWMLLPCATFQFL